MSLKELKRDEVAAILIPSDGELSHSLYFPVPDRPSGQMPKLVRLQIVSVNPSIKREDTVITFRSGTIHPYRRGTTLLQRLRLTLTTYVVPVFLGLLWWANAAENLRLPQRSPQRGSGGYVH